MLYPIDNEKDCPVIGNGSRVIFCVLIGNYDEFPIKQKQASGNKCKKKINFHKLVEVKMSLG